MCYSTQLLSFEKNKSLADLVEVTQIRTSSERTSGAAKLARRETPSS